MSLDTVFNIGHTLNPANSEHRSSRWIQNFRFVSSPKELDNAFGFSIDIDSDFNIDWASIRDIAEKEHLCYFVNKTSNNDTMTDPVFLFGDIFYSNSNGKENNDRFKIFDSEKNSISLLKESFQKGKGKNPLRDIFKNREVDKFKDIILNNKDLSSDLVQDLKTRYPIILFWRQIVKEQQKIELLLKYAPVIMGCSDKTNKEEVETKYQEYVFDKRENITQAKNRVKRWISDENKSRKGKNKLKDDQINYSYLPDELKQFFQNCFNHSVFLHFCFKTDDKDCNWYEMHQCCKIVYNILLSKIAKKTEEEKGFVLTKNIYPPVCTGDKDNDIQFPNFDSKGHFKSFCLKNKNELFDLLFANGILKSYRKALKGTYIKILILPRSITGEIIPSEKLEGFFYDKKIEKSLFADDSWDCLNVEKQQIIFDFVFVDTGGNTHNYLLEISGLQKSRLIDIEKRHDSVSDNISKDAEKTLHHADYKIDLEIAMTAIIGLADIHDDGEVFFSNQIKKDGKDVPYPAYQNHILKIVPRIYQESYFNDEILLPSVVRQIEYCVRNHQSAFISDHFFSQLSQCYYKLKYSLQFMLEIQNNKTSNYMEILKNESYLIGKKLGELAKPLSREINSFQKSYVGMITRRATSKKECMALTNEIIAKLALHDCKYQTFLCGEVLEEIAKMQTFDKEIFAFGFFEGYFKYTVNDSVEKFVERIEDLLSKFSKKEELQTTSAIIREAIDNLKEETYNLNNE